MSVDAGALRDEIELLTASLEDARREHASGDLDDAALDQIERRDGARLAEATARLAGLGTRTDTGPEPTRTLAAPPGAGLRPRRVRRSGWLLAVGIGCLAVAGVVLAVAVADPFATSPPSPRVTRATEVHGLLDSGELLLGEGHPLRALTAFDAALRLAPHDPEALVESAWLRYEFAGLGAHDPRETALGLAALRRAVTLVPDDAGAHLYDGIALLRVRGARAAARAQLAEAARLPETADEEALTAEMLSYVAHHP